MKTDAAHEVRRTVALAAVLALPWFLLHAGGIAGGLAGAAAAAGLYLALLAPAGFCTGVPWIVVAVNTIGVVACAVVSIIR